MAVEVPAPSEVDTWYPWKSQSRAALSHSCLDSVQGWETSLASRFPRWSPQQKPDQGSGGGPVKDSS